MAALNGLSKVAIAIADDPFSASIAKGTGEWAHSFGLQVVVSRQLSKEDADFTNFIHQARSGGAEMVIMCGHYEEAVNVRLALKKSAWRPKAFYASVGPALPRYYQELQGDAELVFSSSQWEPEVVYQPNDKAVLLEPFLKKYGILPSYQAATAFAAGQILELALQKAGRWTGGRYERLWLRWMP
jgi:branched-chain amino acid transport system substrate-binding protein